MFYERRRSELILRRIRTDDATASFELIVGHAVRLRHGVLANDYFPS